ncbi:MAG: formate dehydrogenase, partial [Gammaproteobacteria bacterium]|nr:formate dehydrogenase [Gammaproteobacteria bacterium]
MFDSKFKPNTKHKLYLGLTEEIPFLKKQERLTFARCGITDPLSIEDYKAHGRLSRAHACAHKDRAAIVDEVTQSGLRGRGGAGFPAGIKWQTVLKTAEQTKYI